MDGETSAGEEERRRARSIWHRLEVLHTVTYFSPETAQAGDALGLRGFWMGYFAFRAAPLGPVVPAVVEATFFNFHRRRVERAIPDAWDRAGPALLLDTRAAAAAASLRRLLGNDQAEALAAAVLADLAEAARGAPAQGRPLFAANRSVAPAEPVAALWQAATALREHRGDGHVALLTAAGLGPAEALVLFAASEGMDPEILRTSRGWSEEEWAAAAAALSARGLHGDGGITPAGRALRGQIEAGTDALAWSAYAGLGLDGADRVLDVLRPAARIVARAGELPFPNPVGVPEPEGDRPA